jgi:hypothetical protein
MKNRYDELCWDTCENEALFSMYLTGGVAASRQCGRGGGVADAGWQSD